MLKRIYICEYKLNMNAKLLEKVCENNLLKYAIVESKCF